MAKFDTRRESVTRHSRQLNDTGVIKYRGLKRGQKNDGVVVVVIDDENGRSRMEEKKKEGKK